MYCPRMCTRILICITPFRLGCHETLTQLFFSTESMLRCCLNTHWCVRRRASERFRADGIYNMVGNEENWRVESRSCCVEAKREAVDPYVKADFQSTTRSALEMDPRYILWRVHVVLSFSYCLVVYSSAIQNPGTENEYLTAGLFFSIMFSSF